MTELQQSGDGTRTARLAGRRVAQIAYYLLAAGIAGAATWQITRQVFAGDAVGASPYRSCEEGLRALHDAIENGRVAADALTPPSANEEAPLDRYREEVDRVWRYRDGIAALCHSPEHARMLDALQRLRYSEEHGVRHQGAELTALRRRVRGMMQALLGPSATPETPEKTP